MDIFYTAFTRLLEFLFPTQCLSCGKSGAFFCTSCAAGLPLPQNTLPKDMHARTRYAHAPVKKLIWKLKYHGTFAAAESCAMLLYDTLLSLASEEMMFGAEKEILLVPIPLSKERLRTRGYNQSARIAEKLSARMEGVLVLDGALVRVKNTESQARSISRAERFANMEGAFVVRLPERVLGRTIFLLDDIVTTGATFTAARDTLLSAGARRVICIAIAH